MIVNKELELAREKQRRMIAEAKLEKAQAQLEYVAMMTDVELEDEDDAEQEV